MGYTKEAYVRTETEIEIEFEDVIGYIEHEGLSEAEADELVEAIRKAVDSPVQPTKYNTIMEELAANELQEIINKHGVEAVVAQLKQINL